jgi:hypothetical protein
MTITDLPRPPRDAETAEHDDEPVRFLRGGTSSVEIPKVYVRGHLFTAACVVDIWTQGNQWADGHVRREVCIAGLHHDDPLSRRRQEGAGRAEGDSRAGGSGRRNP